MWKTKRMKNEIERVENGTKRVEAKLLENETNPSLNSTP